MNKNMEKIYLYRKYFSSIDGRYKVGVYRLYKNRDYLVECYRVATQGYLKSDLLLGYFGIHYGIRVELKEDMLYKNPYYEEEIS